MKNFISKFIVSIFICAFFSTPVFAQNSEQFLVQKENNFSTTQLCQSIIVSFDFLSKHEVPTAFATQTLGWHFIRVEYIVSAGDGASTGKFSNGDIYTETNKGIGEKNNFTTTITRVDKNGKTIASGKAITVWTDPPKFFSVDDRPEITVKRTVESEWGINQLSVGFDMADIKPGSASAGKIYFATTEGKTQVQSYEGTMKAKHMIKGNKQGDQRAITIYLNGYAYKYYYEWRDSQTKTEVNTEYETGTPGWHFLRVEYIVSAGDGASTGKFSNGDIYTETNKGIGEKNNFTTTITRTDKNGKTIASGKAITVWTDPPKFFSVEDRPEITVKRTVESEWGINKFSVGFDMADIKPGSASAGKIYFATTEGKTQIQPYEGIMKAKHMIKGNKQGDQRAITIYLNGYAYKYYYEWRD